MVYGMCIGNSSTCYDTNPTRLNKNWSDLRDPGQRYKGLYENPRIFVNRDIAIRDQILAIELCNRILRLICDE